MNFSNFNNGNAQENYYITNKYKKLKMFGDIGIIPISPKPQNP
jgi:hypothetical protein